MKKTTSLKKLLVSMAIVSSTALTFAPATTQAGASANIGYVSNYVFRGVQQTNTGSGSAGLDYEDDSGLYVGTWGADVDDGLEYDFYAGWGGAFSDVNLGIGATYYGYTKSAFDDPYQEVNLSLGYGPVTLGYDLGQHLKGATTGPKDKDYSDISIGMDYESVSATLGVWDEDTDAKDDALTYFDLSYSTELAAGLDGSITYTYALSEASGATADNYLIFGISKAFDF